MTLGSPIRGIKTIASQVKTWKQEVANPRRRIPLGMADLDYLVRGPAAGEVFTVIARSHVGKSLFATNVVANNPEERTVFFSLEMPEHQVLANLTAHVYKIPADDLEEIENTGQLPDFVNDLGTRLPFTVIVDDAHLSFDSMSAYLQDYETFYGERPRLAIIDYLEEVGGGKASAEGWVRAEASASAAKAWAKSEKIATIVLHQTNRTVEQWEPPNSNSAKGAGYTEADVMIGMWRPGWDPSTPFEVRQHRDKWVGMNVLKNRVRGKRHDGLLYRIDPSKTLVPEMAWGPRLSEAPKVPEYMQ